MEVVQIKNKWIITDGVDLPLVASIVNNEIVFEKLEPLHQVGTIVGDK